MIYGIKNKTKTGTRGHAPPPKGQPSIMVYISSNIPQLSEKEQKTMEFFENNWQYIQSNAAAKAVEIATKTGRLADIEDFKQEILLFLVRRGYRFDQEKGQATTFIEVCMDSARKNIIRNIYRKRKRFIIDTV